MRKPTLLLTGRDLQAQDFYDVVLQKRRDALAKARKALADKRAVAAMNP